MQRRPPPVLPDWLEEMLPFNRYRVEVEHHEMHVMEAGEGRPVVMLHGNPTWGFLYRRVARALPTGSFRVILPDLVGLGFSEKPTDPGVHTLDNHARWFATLLAKMSLSDFIFVGQDWGGPIGYLAFAENEELRPAGMVVLNTVVSPPKPGFRPTLFHRFSQTPVLSDLAFRLVGFPQVALGLAQNDRGSISGDVSRAYRFPLRNRLTNVAPLALARMVPDSLEHPSVEGLKKCQRFITEFDAPAAIVWGDSDPILGGVRSWVEKLMPHAPVTRTDAGHFVQEEVPEEIADAIRDVDARLRTITPGDSAG